MTQPHQPQVLKTCGPSTYKAAKWTSSIHGVSADSLNNHYAAISTDQNQPPPTKTDEPSSTSPYITEWCMFKIFDTLYPTATGLDHRPASPILQAINSLVQHVHLYFHSPTTVEVSVHPPSP